MTISIRIADSEIDRAFIEALNLRLIEVIDAPAHSKDEVELFQHGFTATAWSDNIGRNATFLAVRESGERLGYLHIREGFDEIAKEKCGYIALLAVAPNAEGQGVSHVLIKQAESWARNQGFSRVALDVFASNHRGLRFYEKSGYLPETIRVIKNI